MLWNMLQPKPKATLLYAVIDAILIAWFCYYSWVDANDPNIYLRIIYTAIDLLSLVEFTDFFSEYILTTFIVKYFGLAIKNNLRYNLYMISTVCYIFKII